MGQQLSDFGSPKVKTTTSDRSREDVNKNEDTESYKEVKGKAFGKGGHNRIFHTMVTNDSLDGTTKTQIILSGTVQYQLIGKCDTLFWNTSHFKKEHF